jgi:Putative exopolysaccharide Exporter (EPS-E)
MQTPKHLNPVLSNTRWPPPVDVRDLAIRLETEGVSDSVAREEFGFADTWEMAEAHFPELSGRSSARNHHRTEVVLSSPKLSSAIIDYLSGISFALPLLFSCVAILLMRFSLWGGDLPSGQASAVGVGIACSFIASGGFVQAMSRQGLWYIGTGQFRTCAQSTRDWLCGAALILLVLGLAGVAAGLYLDWLPGLLCSLAALFYFSLALLWLATGVLYMLKQNLLVAAAAVLGIASVVLLHRGFGMNLLAAQIVSIIIAAGFAISISIVILKNQSRGETGVAVRTPPGKTLYYLWPYFMYGCLYYLFLFSDRLLAWTARTEGSGLLIQFRGSYEAGQDVALFAFIFQVGWVYFATVRFYDRLKALQQELTAAQSEEFNRSLTAFYWRMGASFMPLAIVTTIAVFLFARGVGFQSDPLHWRVMQWSLAGYVLVVLSLRNVSLLFALSRPLCVLWAVGCACAVNISVGYLASRFGTYDRAVIGFTLGAAVFAAISTWYSLKTLRRLDYYYVVSAA